MKNIKKVLVINQDNTLSEYLEKLPAITDEKQKEFPDYLVKVYSFLTKDKKVVISTTPSNYKFMGVESGVYDIMDIKDLNLFTLDQEMLEIYEIVITKNSLIPTYQDAVNYAQHKADELFKNDGTRIPIVYIIDYKFGNNPVAISASIFGEIDAEGNTVPLLNPSAPVNITGGNTEEGIEVQNSINSIQNVEKLSAQNIPIVGMKLVDIIKQDNVPNIKKENTIIKTDKGDLPLSPYYIGGIDVASNKTYDEIKQTKHRAISFSVYIPDLSDDNILSGGEINKSITIKPNNEGEFKQFSSFSGFEVPTNKWTNIILSIKDWEVEKGRKGTYYYKIIDVFVNGEYFNTYKEAWRSNYKDYFHDLKYIGHPVGFDKETIEKHYGKGYGDCLLESFKGLIKDYVGFEDIIDVDKAKEIYNATKLTNGVPKLEGLHYIDIKYNKDGDSAKGCYIGSLYPLNDKYRKTYSFTKSNHNLHQKLIYDDHKAPSVNNELLQEALKNMKKGMVITSTSMIPILFIPKEAILKDGEFNLSFEDRDFVHEHKITNNGSDTEDWYRRYLIKNDLFELGYYWMYQDGRTKFSHYSVFAKGESVESICSEYGIKSSIHLFIV